jgi:hypothetical protein
MKKNLQMQYTIRLKVVLGLDHILPIRKIIRKIVTSNRKITEIFKL